MPHNITLGHLPLYGLLNIYSEIPGEASIVVRLYLVWMTIFYIGSQKAGFYFKKQKVAIIVRNLLCFYVSCGRIYSLHIRYIFL